MAAALDLKQFMMPYIGQPITATLTDEDDKALFTATNAALLEILGTGERRQERKAELVREPETVSLGAVTENSKAITFSGYETYMKGCTIKIGSLYNRLVNTNGTVSLESPYTGSTATNVSATVYFDCVTIDAGLEAVGVPVLLDNQHTVELLPNLNSLTERRNQRSTLPTPAEGTPRYALVEDSLASEATPTLRFVFDSLPTASHTLSFLATLKPPQITTWADATPYFLGGGRDSLVLWPVALYHLRTYPYFIGSSKEVEDNYVVAKGLWQNFYQKGPRPRAMAAPPPRS